MLSLKAWGNVDEPVWVDLIEFLKKMEELSPKFDDAWDDTRRFDECLKS